MPISPHPHQQGYLFEHVCQPCRAPGGRCLLTASSSPSARKGIPRPGADHLPLGVSQGGRRVSPMFGGEDSSSHAQSPGILWAPAPAPPSHPLEAQSWGHSCPHVHHSSICSPLTAPTDWAVSGLTGGPTECAQHPVLSSPGEEGKNMLGTDAVLVKYLPSTAGWAHECGG